MTSVAESLTVQSSSGVPISHTRTGTGPPLVLVHGTGDDGTCWRAVTQSLASRFTVYVMNRRGRGGSGDTTEHSIELEALDIAAIVDEAGPGVTLVAHSFGAICALEAADQMSGVDCLVLYEPPIPMPGSMDLSEVAAECRRLCAQGQHEDALGRFLIEVTGLDKSLFEFVRRIPGFAERAGLAATIAREIEATQCYVPDRDRLHALALPVLLLTGEESPAPLRAAVTMLDEVLPAAGIEVLSGQSHRAMESAPDAFVTAVSEFASSEKEDN